MILRPATLDDVPALSRLGRDSFTAAFGRLYRPEDLAHFLDMAHSEDAIAGELTDGRHVHRLADDDGALAGFCKLRLQSDYSEYSDAQKPIGLCQLYTDPALTGKGIGAALMDWALVEARERGADAVQLSVWSENFGAQRFYQRYGFAKIADIGFAVGEQVDEEFLYELRL